MKGGCQALHPSGRHRHVCALILYPQNRRATKVPRRSQRPAEEAPRKAPEVPDLSGLPAATGRLAAPATDPSEALFEDRESPRLAGHFARVLKNHQVRSLASYPCMGDTYSTLTVHDKCKTVCSVASSMLA